MKWFFNFAGRLFLLFALLAFFTAIWIVADGLDDQTQSTDVAVVLGHAVLPSGQPGPVLRERLEVAVKLYRQGKFPLIVVSGATHLDGYDEARGMAMYLSTQGIPPEVILEDHNGDNTAATAQNLARIMRERHLHSVMIISHYYHITRTKFLLHEYGITKTQQAHAGLVQLTWRSARNLSREVLALYYYMGRYYFPIVQEKVKQDLSSTLSNKK